MKRGDNSGKGKQWKKVKDTILTYSHIGIYAIYSASENNEVYRVATDKQTRKKHTYRVKTEETFLPSSFFY